MRVDRLTIDAVVNDNFTSTLKTLTRQLKYVDRVASQTVESITADVDTAAAMGQLEALERQIQRVDDDVTIGEGGLFQGSPNLTDEQALGVADMFNPKSAFRDPIEEMARGGGGGGATADGGSDGDGGIDIGKLARDAQEAFGAAFDPDALVDDADRAITITDFLEGDLSEFIDTRAISQAIADGALDADILENLRSDDNDKALDAFRTLRQQGFTNLPTTDTFEGIRPILDTIENFDATSLNNLRASLFPLLATFVGALPAAIAGVVGLAGAAIAAAGVLGAIGGLGALGVVMAEDMSLQGQFSKLVNSFKQSFAPIAEALRPTFLAALDSLEQFGEEIGQTSEMLRGLSDEALGVLDAIEEYIIGGLANVIAFGDVAIDMFARLDEQLDGFTITGVLASILATTTDELLFLLSAIMDVAPLILHLSEGFLLVTASLLKVLGFVGMLLNTFPILTRAVGALIGMTLTAVSAFLLFNGVVGVLSGTFLATALKSIPAMIVGLYGLTTTIISTLLPALTALQAKLLSIAILTGVGIPLAIAAISAASKKMAEFGSNIKGVRGELRKLSRATRRGNAMSFSMGRNGVANGGAYVDYTEQNVTINAPSKDTGTKVARKHEYAQRVHEKRRT